MIWKTEVRDTGDYYEPMLAHLRNKFADQFVKQTGDILEACEVFALFPDNSLEVSAINEDRSYDVCFSDSGEYAFSVRPFKPVTTSDRIEGIVDQIGQAIMAAIASLPDMTPEQAEKIATNARYGLHCDLVDACERAIMSEPSEDW